jgi:8-oxo-dGTP pyrophosphatase MutT (NUDIX family)
MRVQSLWDSLGIVLFWLSWPLIALVLKHSSRTRVLVTYADEVLVTQSWLGDGKWSLPGGGLHLNEAPLHGVQRELREETSVNLPLADFKARGQYRFQSHGVNFTQLLFRTKAPTRYPLTPQRLEIAKADWIPIAQLSARNAGGDVLEALRSWLG